MAMKTKYRKNGYSESTATDYVNQHKPIYSLSTDLEEQPVFENGKPTGEIQAYKAWFTQEGLEPFQVKFEDKINLPAYMTLVKFDHLEACEIRYNVYFRANNLKEVS